MAIWNEGLFLISFALNTYLILELTFLHFFFSSFFSLA